MTSTAQLAARILEASAGGYAGLAASRLFDRHPEIAKRYDRDGFASWKAQLERWLGDLSAALEVGEPTLFASRVEWAKSALAARESTADDLQAGLEALRDVLRERLPEAQAAEVVPVLDHALTVAAGPDPQAGALDPQPLSSRPALSYLQAILEGRPRDAVEQLLQALDGGTPVKKVYLDVLIAAQREVGRMWHAGELSIAEEHLVTTTTQRVMALLCERAQPAQRDGKTVVLACVAGNVHDIGIRAISDFFEMSGWRAINLGTDVPADEIVRSVQFFDADLAVLAATLDPHLKHVQRTIEKIRELEDREVKVIVGGPVFEHVPKLWQKVGADGYSANIEDAEPLGARLTR